MRMPASAHSIDKAQPKDVTRLISAMVAAHHEAIQAELEEQVAELKRQIAELRADRRSVRDSWRNIRFAPGDRVRQRQAATRTETREALRQQRRN
jgi:hypothetical protein